MSSQKLDQSYLTPNLLCISTVNLLRTVRLSFYPSYPYHYNCYKNVLHISPLVPSSVTVNYDLES